MPTESIVATESKLPLVFIGSNFHKFFADDPILSFEAPGQEPIFPSDVTLGFRHNFWRVFSQIAEYDRTTFTFSWLGADWQFESLWAADSRGVDFAAQLDDPVNAFLVFVIRPKIKLDRSIRELIFEHHLTEQTAVTQLIEAFRARPSYRFIKTFEHARNLNALFVWDAPLTRVTVANAVALFAFYSFALLLIWKITREQTTINLTSTKNNFRQNLQILLRLRTYIIDVDRFLLTRNVSNDPEVTELAKSLRTRFALRSKLDGLLPLNEAIQRHMDTAAQLRGDLKSTIISVTAFVIAAVGLPISLMSMLLALSDTAPVVGRGITYVGNRPIIQFLATALTFSFAILVITASVAVLVPRLFRRKT